MSGKNLVIIIGNLGADPETRSMPGGGMVANVSIATSETWKDKATGEKKERTEWSRCVFFNRLAEIVAEYLKKGSKVYVEGSLRTNKWQDKDGHDRYTTEIVAREMQMLDSKQGGGQGQSAAGRNGHSDHQQQGAAQHTASTGFDGPDDIPF